MTWTPPFAGFVGGSAAGRAIAAQGLAQTLFPPWDGGRR
jgi:hypothetical protein